MGCFQNKQTNNQHGLIKANCMALRITYLYKFSKVFKKGFIIHGEFVIICVSYSVVFNFTTKANEIPINNRHLIRIKLLMATNGIVVNPLTPMSDENKEKYQAGL